MSDSRRFVSDVGVTFVASIIGMILGFPITVLLGRYLGADDLGLYRMVNTIFGTIMLFISIGVPASVTKYVAEFRDNNEKIEQIISTSLVVSILLGLFSFILFYLCADLFAEIFHMTELSCLLRILAFAFPFSIINGILIGFLIGLREMTKNAFISIISNILMLILTFILVLYYGIRGAVGGIVFSSFLTTLFLIVTQRIPNVTFCNFFNTANQLINFGSKTLLSNAINIINYQADTLMIGYFMTKTDVGIYGIAIIFAKLIWIFPDSVQRLTFPLISEYHAKEMNEFIQILVDKCMKYSCLFLIFCITFLLFFGKELIILIFGTEFKQSYSPLIVLLIGTLFYGITKSVGSIFASVGNVSLIYKIPLFSAVSNIILNFILIPIYGMNGAAVATTVSLIVSTALMIYFMKTLINIKVEFIWYIRAICLSFLLLFIYQILRNFINNILLGSILMITELILFFTFLISDDDKNKIFRILKISHFPYILKKLNFSR